jgi:hypothetical protein
MKIIHLALAAALASAAPAAAQELAQEQAPANDPYADAKALCGGPIAILRGSRIIEGGTMDGFLAAVAAHSAWYRDHGYTENHQEVLRVVAEGDAGQRILSEDQVMTLHINPVVPEERDDEWTAFVDQYRANSMIETETYVCLGELTVR